MDHWKIGDYWFFGRVDRFLNGVKPDRNLYKYSQCNLVVAVSSPQGAGGERYSRDVSVTVWPMRMGLCETLIYEHAHQVS